MRSFRLKHGEQAVSPVVGVMLMLVVTIIIAAVVSAFAGGLTAGNQKAPTVSMDIHLRNDGTGNSYFMMKVLSVSEPIPTKDLKIVTSWINSTGGSGGATMVPNTNNTHYTTYPSGKWYSQNSPAGYSAGVLTGNNYAAPQAWFGNYTWTSGTTMINWPSNYGYPAPTSYKGNAYDNGGATAYNYWPSWTTYIGNGGTEVDSLTAELGVGWNSLRPGDTLNVKVIHVPSGKTIVNQQAIVEG